MARVQVANNNRTYAYFVKEVGLFGSFFRGEEMVGDIDLAVSLLMKTDGIVDLRIEQIGRRGIEGMFRPQIEVLTFLRSRSSWIDIQQVETVSNIKCPYLSIYRIPHPEQIACAIALDRETASVEHLHKIVEFWMAHRAKIRAQNQAQQAANSHVISS